MSYSLAEMLTGNEPEFIPDLVEVQIQGRTPLQLAWRRLRRDKVSMISLGFVIFLCLVALFAPLLTALIGHPPNTEYSNTGLSIYDHPVGPSRAFLLGTDDLGRDVLSRIIYGSRISLEVGIGATALALVFGVLLGLVSGYYGGRIDAVIARFIDILLAFPVLLFAIALVARFGPSLGLILFVIALFQWPLIARLVRGQVIALREREFVEAARFSRLEQPPDHVPRDRPEPDSARDRLRHLVDPGQHRPRGDAVLSRSRDPTANRVLGQHDRRGSEW